MSTERMHEGELDIDTALVRRLLSAQFPQWLDRVVERVRSAGTTHAIFRIGRDRVARLPRTPEFLGDLEKEHRWLPRLAPLLPLAVPTPLAQGEPGEGYPWPWSIYAWIEGEDATEAPFADPRRAAVDLARFIGALRQVSFAEEAPPGRGLGLSERDRPTRVALQALRGTIDTDAATAVWEASLHAPPWREAPVWTHGDLIPTNVLLRGGRLCAVIDFGCVGVGDPACDLVAAWTVLPPETRDVLRSALDVDEATWTRGRGWALSQALAIVPYYRETNSVLVGVAMRVIAEALADFRETGGPA